MDLWNMQFDPMLLKEVDKPFDSKDYIYEIKYDGIRSLIYVSQKTFKIISRHQKDITNLYPELKEIQKLVKDKTIFDGEIICTENGLPSFSKLQERSHLKDTDKIKRQVKTNSVTFICFDIIYDNKDMTELSILERKKILEKYPNTEYFNKNMYIKKNGVKLFNKIKEIGLEGIVAKKINSPYEINTRTFNWLKIKNYQEESFYIGGYKYKENTFVFVVSLGEYINNKLSFVGKIFIPKKNKLFKLILNEKKTNSNFINNKEKNVIYIKPKYKCLVRYIERTRNNNLRQPFFVGEDNEIS